MAGRLLSRIDEHRMSGVESMVRTGITTGITCTSGTLRLSYFVAVNDDEVTKVSITTGSTAAGATPTLVRFGLYSIASNGDGTLVASTPNDTALLSSIDTLYTKSFSAPYSLVHGNRYALAFLIVTGAATPTILGRSQAGAMTALAPRITGIVSGQTDLPASFLESGVTVLNGQYWMRAWA